MENLPRVSIKRHSHDKQEGIADHAQAARGHGTDGNEGGFGIWMLQIYVNEHHIVTNIALAAITFVLVGVFLLATAITLYAMTRIGQRLAISEHY